MACPACSQGKERSSTKHSQQIGTAGGAAAPDQQQQPQSPGSSPSAGRVSRQASYPLEVWSQCAELLRDSRLLPAMEHLQRVPKQQHSRALVCCKASIPSRIRKQLILNVDLAFHFIMPLMVGTRHSIKTMLRLKHLSKRCSCLADGQGKLPFSRSENGCGHHAFELMWQTGASEQLQRTRPLLAPDNAGRCLTGLCSSAATPGTATADVRVQGAEPSAAPDLSQHSAGKKPPPRAPSAAPQQSTFYRHQQQERQKRSGDGCRQQEAVRQSAVAGDGGSTALAQPPGLRSKSRSDPTADRQVIRKTAIPSQPNSFSGVQKS